MKYLLETKKRCGFETSAIYTEEDVIAAASYEMGDGFYDCGEYISEITTIEKAIDFFHYHADNGVGYKITAIADAEADKKVIDSDFASKVFDFLEERLGEDSDLQIEVAGTGSTYITMHDFGKLGITVRFADHSSVHGAHLSFEKISDVTDAYKNMCEFDAEKVAYYIIEFVTEKYENTK